METYFKVMFYMDYVVPLVLLGILAVLMLVLFVPVMVSSAMNAVRYRCRRRWEAKFFTDHGYRRELLDVPSVGGGAFWGWMRGEYGEGGIADDRRLRKMTKHEIIEKYS